MDERLDRLEDIVLVMDVEQWPAIMFACDLMGNERVTSALPAPTLAVEYARTPLAAMAGRT